MLQKLTVIHIDEEGRRGRVVFTQAAEFSPTKFEVQGLDPSEVVKLCMLMMQLGEQTIQNLATAKNDARVVN